MENNMEHSQKIKNRTIILSGNPTLGMNPKEGK
jgi:bacterioferritin (cytochrome b1)